MPKLSIITPCYNTEKYIGQAIESVIAQTFADWEYVIVDDGCTDNSADVIASYATSESRVRLIRQPNGGMCNARNNGFSNCSAESQYLLFFDADDFLEPQMLEVMVKYLDEHPQVGVAYCDFTNIDGDGKLLDTIDFPRVVPSFFGITFLPYNTPETPLVAIAAGLGGGLDGRAVFRRCIYEKTSGWDEDLGKYNGQIIDLFIQCALLSEVHFIPQRLHQYRQHSSNQLHKTGDFNAQAQKIIDKWKEGKGLTPEQKLKIAKVLQFYEGRLKPFVLVQFAADLMGKGQWGAALKLYLQAATKYLLSFLPPSRSLT